MDWLKQLPRTEGSPGTALLGLDLDGHRTKQVSRSLCQKSVKSRLVEQTGWGIVMGVRKLCGWGRGRDGTNNSRVPLHLPKY